MRENDSDHFVSSHFCVMTNLNQCSVSTSDKKCLVLCVVADAADSADLSAVLYGNRNKAGTELSVRKAKKL